MSRCRRHCRRRRRLFFKRVFVDSMRLLDRTKFLFFSRKAILLCATLNRWMVMFEKFFPRSPEASCYWLRTRIYSDFGSRIRTHPARKEKEKQGEFEWETMQANDILGQFTNNMLLSWYTWKQRCSKHNSVQTEKIKQNSMGQKAICKEKIQLTLNSDQPTTITARI